ncbi:MAG TPA: pyridoxamine 5'-phosphate oxidase family protein, partial [Candidatus Methylomirabilis sp.]|nr:pyridoxamine 5'-phosphate oxidase family protein [Candidatus Methylomirabilis sp.]
MKQRGTVLPSGLLAALSQVDLPSRLDRALSLVTLDPEGRPHPMLCSYLELLATDAKTIRLAIAAASGSARNLEERGAATLIVVDPERTT